MKMKMRQLLGIAISLVTLAGTAHAELITVTPSAGSSSSSGIISGSTTCTSCTANGVLFNNAGVVTTDAGLTKAAGATGIVTAGGILRTSSAGSVGAPSLVVGNATTGLYSVSTTGVGLSANGVNILDWGITNGFQTTITNGSGGQYALLVTNTNGRGLYVSGTTGTDLVIDDTTSTQTSFLLNNAGSNKFQFQWDGTEMILNTVANAAVQFFTNNTLRGQFTAGGTFNVNFGVLSQGAVPVITGTCGSFGTAAGGSTAGTISSSAVCAAASTIIMTFAAGVSANNGWVCDIVDRTTSTAVIRQTSTAAGSATFTVTVATAGNDVLQYKCIGY